MGEVAGPRRRPVARPDPARRRELPDQRHAARAGATSSRSARVKGAAARVNAELGRPRRGRSPTRSSRPPRRGRRRRATTTQFPIDVFQTGSGTARNMNTNEVIATLAGEALGATCTPTTTSTPRQSQQRRLPHRASTSRPTAAVVQRPGPGARATSRRRWRRKAEEFADVVKSGRTHLMDATPVTLGQEFGGYAAPGPATASSGSRPTLPRVAELPLGGTAVGTGINTPTGFAADGDRRAAPTTTGLPLTEARDHFEAQGARDGARRGSRRSCATIAVGLTKICNDLRWMGSGPRAGLGEIHLPDLQPGSVDHARQGQPGHARGDADGRARR